MTSGVYKIINTFTGSCYVGSAVDVDLRWRTHKYSLRHHKKSPPKLQCAWDKYGESAFTFSVVLICRREDTLLYEQAFIDALKPKYNTRLRAESNLGVVWSAETNRKKAKKDSAVYTVRGVTGTFSELVAHFGMVSVPVARSRIDRGSTVEQAVTMPKASRQEIGRRAAATHKANGTHPKARMETAFGVTASLRDLHAKYGVTNRSAFYRRVRLGWTVEKALTTPQRSW